MSRSPGIPGVLATISYASLTQAAAATGSLRCSTHHPCRFRNEKSPTDVASSGWQLPVGRLESGGRRLAVSLSSRVDLTNQPLEIGNALLHDLVADTHGVHGVDNGIEIGLLAREELVVLPPHLGDDVVEPDALRDLRGTFHPERDRVRDEAAKPDLVKKTELSLELRFGDRMPAAEEVERRAGVVVDPRA